MSFMYYDANTVPRLILQDSQRLYNRFSRAWGTKIVEGVEVYEDKLYFYRNGYIFDDDNLRRFVSALGMSWTSLTETKVDSEIEDMFFRLEPGFPYSGKRAYDSDTTREDGYRKPTSDEFYASIKNTFDDFVMDEDDTDAKEEDYYVTVTVEYGGGLRRYIRSHEMAWDVSATGTIQTAPLNKEEIRATLASNPWYYYANSRDVDYDEDGMQYNAYSGNSSAPITPSGLVTPRSAPICDTASNAQYGVFALLDDNNAVFTPVLNEDGSLLITNERVSSVEVSNGANSVAYSYTLSFKYTPITETTSNILYGKLDQWYDSYTVDTSTLDSVDRHDNRVTKQIDTKIKRLLLSTMKLSCNLGVVETALYLSVSEFTGSGIECTKYLKVDGVKAMRKREFKELIQRNISTDYTVEDSEWWEKALAVVILIVAVVAAIFVPPLLGVTGTLATAAAGASAAAMTITLGSMVLSMVGGLSAGDLVKGLGKLAVVVGYLATFLGITAMINNIANKIAIESIKEVGKEVTKQAIEESLKSVTVVDIAMEIVKEAVSSVTNLFTNAANMSVTEIANATLGLIKNATQGYNYYMDQESAKLEAEYNAIKAEEEEYNESLLNMPYMNAAGTYSITHERLSTPDMLQDLSASMDEKIGQDSNFMAWKTNVQM